MRRWSIEPNKTIYQELLIIVVVSSVAPVVPQRAAGAHNCLLTGYHPRESGVLIGPNQVDFGMSQRFLQLGCCPHLVDLWYPEQMNSHKLARQVTGN